MKFTQPSFTVPTGHRPAESCSHGWLDVRGRCVFCGRESPLVALATSPSLVGIREDVTWADPPKSRN